MIQSRKYPSDSTIFLSIIILCLSIFMLGCKSDQTPIQQRVGVTEDDIADMIAASLGSGTSTNGLSAQIGEAATVAGGGSLGKQSRGQTVTAPLFDTTIVRHDTVGDYSYNFTFHYSYEFLNAGNQLNFMFSLHGFYDTPLLSSQDTAASSLQFTGIVAADSQYTVNATYSRLGTQTSKVRDHNSFSSALTVTLTNMKVNKATKRIQSGAASITIEGRTPDDIFFSYSATLTILGYQLATLNVNGKTYTIDLASGVATPA